MVTRSLVLLLFAAFAATGCYHATVDTGLRSSSDVIEVPWASSWVYGLVPPNTVSAQAKCKNGVARVETVHSFVNSLVGMITIGIYTPMTIKVTCAAGGSAMLDGKSPDLVLDENATDAEIQVAFARAADMAVRTGDPVYVKY